MLAEPTPTKKSLLKNPFLYSSLAVAVILLYIGWIVFSRWQDNRSIDKRAAVERTEKQREQDRIAIEQLGGKDLAIQVFYANPGAIRRGETAKLCYGVANAKNVTLEPQTNPVWPSHNNCVDVTPKKDTTYTLTISDASGHSQSQSLTVKVR
ncbi:MAG TPA: hypothetical protein VOA78_05065 [Candidatus Dormibacteraeota bacterium]|nr:hypothetical protein [Candidatus Dormibacteraeota bacterium]